MKKAVWALAALALIGCVKEMERPETPAPVPSTRTVTVTAGFDPVTKTAYDAEGKFSWVEGDKIGVLASNGTETKQFTFVAQEAGPTAMFTGEVEAGYELLDYASYPFTGEYDGYACNDLAWDKTNGTEYGWRLWGSVKPSLKDPLSCTPLIGTRISGTRASYTFTTATGIVKFTVQNVPMETDFAYLTVPDASDANLNGWYDISETGCISMDHAVEPWKDRYNWNAPDHMYSTLDYYFFLPVGTLPVGTTFALRDASWNVIYSIQFQKAVEVERNVITVIKPIVFEPEPMETLGTGLRTLHIITPDGQGITTKETWKKGCVMQLLDDDGKVYFVTGEGSAKGRGNSTWGYDKKPYNIKLADKVDLIGTGADKSWVLLANWMDRTLLRNDVTFELGRRSGLSWTPSGEFVELFLDGVHMGNYWLGEKIKTGKARLTADYIVELDTYYDEDWRFYSEWGYRVNQGQYGMPVNVKEPDSEDMTEELFQTLMDLVSGVEGSIYQGTGDYMEKIDAQSFADWYIVQELVWNGEPNHPKSCYFYFLDGVMYAGPLWDFDWNTFQPSASGLRIRDCIYYGQLLSDPAFVQILRDRWAVLKPAFQTIGDYIDAKADAIRTSEALNWAMWPCTDSWINGDENMTFDDAVSRLRSALLNRIDTLDAAIAAL